jgi:nucleoside-diphosphate-sugar epimerase
MVAEKGIVLITGACGLIGKAMTKTLAERYRVIGFDILDSPPSMPLSAYMRVDLSSDESVQKGLQKVRTDFGDRIASVIHLAAYYNFSGEPSPLYEKVTVRGTERLLKALQPSKVEQFVFSSTMLVHAPCERGQKINENWPIEPKWDYPKSKVDAEELIRRGRGDIRAVLARIAGVYDDDAHSIPIANQIQRIYERWLTGRVYPGDLEKGQAFVHLEDLVDAVDKMIQRRGELPPTQALLIGEDKTLGYGELQERLGMLIHNEEWKTTNIPKSVAKTGAWFEEKIPGVDPFIKPWMIDLADDHFELDVSLAKRLLRWEPKRFLGDTLPIMVEKLKADPAAFYRQNKLELPSKLEKKEE